jgi:hypothetical protein
MACPVVKAVVVGSARIGDQTTGTSSGTSVSSTNPPLRLEATGDHLRCAALLSQRRQRQHRPRSGPHYFLGHPAENQVRKPCAPVLQIGLHAQATSSAAIILARESARGRSLR